MILKNDLSCSKTLVDEDWLYSTVIINVLFCNLSVLVWTNYLHYGKRKSWNINVEGEFKYGNMFWGFFFHSPSVLQSLQPSPTCLLWSFWTAVSPCWSVRTLQAAHRLHLLCATNSPDRKVPAFTQTHTNCVSLSPENQTYVRFEAKESVFPIYLVFIALISNPTPVESHTFPTNSSITGPSGRIISSISLFILLSMCWNIASF